MCLLYCYHLKGVKRVGCIACAMPLLTLSPVSTVYWVVILIGNLNLIAKFNVHKHYNKLHVL